MTAPRFHGFDPIPRRHNAPELAAAAGSYGRHAAPLDQRAREDRYRRQTGRVNRCEDDQEVSLDFIPPSERAHLLGLTPRQRRRSDKKGRRNEDRALGVLRAGRR